MPELQVVTITVEHLQQLISAEVKAAVKEVMQANAPTAAPGNYSTAELCKAFKISETTVWRLERKGLLKPVILNRKKIFLGSDVDALIKSNKLKQRG